MRLLASGLRAVAKKRRVKSTTWVKSVTQNDNTVYREEKRVFQADTDTTPQESPVMSFRNRKQELKTLEITALALEIVSKREDCKRRQLELRQLELERQQAPPYGASSFPSASGSGSAPASESAPTSPGTPTPDTPSWTGASSIEADIIRIRGLLITSFPKFCTEIDAFRSRYGIDFSHTHQILESRAIIRVLNLYSDVKTLHLWETDKNRHKYLRLCEQVIEDWQVWACNGLLTTKSPFETAGYKELKRKMGGEFRFG